MAGDIDYRKELVFEYGVVAQVSPLIRRVVANNPGPFTFHGTGTYIVGRGKVAIIDPGPVLADHLSALLEAVGGEEVTALLITHTHLDHSPAAQAIKKQTGALTYGFGPHGGGRGDQQVEAGGDYDFAPDVVFGEGDEIGGSGWTLQAVHTPGHTSNHLCFALAEETALFSGDHVMGWSTTVISPPDGDMRTYMESLQKLLGRDDRVYWPTHGPQVEDSHPFVQSLIEHRHERERQILACLAAGVRTIPEMVARIYVDVPKVLHGAAGRSVLAHLIHMTAEGRVRCDGPPTAASTYDR
jgi:glyoxylase-like metal-dependent hydrolase (beta-lactamase superfamily II)